MINYIIYFLGYFLFVRQIANARLLITTLAVLPIKQENCNGHTHDTRDTAQGGLYKKVTNK